MAQQAALSLMVRLKRLDDGDCAQVAWSAPGAPSKCPFRDSGRTVGAFSSSLRFGPDNVSSGECRLPPTSWISSTDKPNFGSPIPKTIEWFKVIHQKGAIHRHRRTDLVRGVEPCMGSSPLQLVRLAAWKFAELPRPDDEGDPSPPELWRKRSQSTGLLNCRQSKAL